MSGWKSMKHTEERKGDRDGEPTNANPPNGAQAAEGTA